METYHQLLDQNRMDKDGFAKWLQDLLSEKNLSQREFSRLTGVSTTQISRYLHGESMPLLEFRIKRMAQVLEVDLDDLYFRLGLKRPLLDDFIEYYQKRNLSS